MVKKYIVHGGHIQSQNDQQMHYISPDRVAQLYGVDHKDCHFVYNINDLRGVDESKFIILKPRGDGNYELPKESPPVSS